MGEELSINILNKLNTTFQSSRKFLQKFLEDYIVFKSETKQLILKEKTVSILCKQAESRIEQLKNLQPDLEEGLIATIEHKKIQVKLHFTPEKITLHDDYIEGQLLLLKPPQFHTESFIYLSLIAGWQIFLGGQIPNGALPEGVRLENNKVYYTLPRNQLQLLNTFFHTLRNGSTLITFLKKGDLIITSSVALHLNDFKLQNLIQVLKLKSNFEK